MVHSHYLSLAGEVSFVHDLGKVDVHLEHVYQRCEGGEDCSAYSFDAYAWGVIDEKVGDEEHRYIDVFSFCAELADCGVPVD